MTAILYPLVCVSLQDNGGIARDSGMGMMFAICCCGFVTKDLCLTHSDGVPWSDGLFDIFLLLQCLMHGRAKTKYDLTDEMS